MISTTLLWDEIRYGSRRILAYAKNTLKTSVDIVKTIKNIWVWTSDLALILGKVDEWDELDEVEQIIFDNFKHMVEKNWAKVEIWPEYKNKK